MLRNRSDAEEVLQEVFLQAWRCAPHYDPSRGSPEAWLIMMARSGRSTRFGLRVAFPTGPRRPPLEIAEPDARMSRGGGGEGARDDGAARVDVAQREVLELAFYEGLSQTEIATRTGAPLGTVKTRTRMALDRLRQTFAMKGWSR